MFDNEFYQMSIKDNVLLLDITEKENVKIPHMDLKKLKYILFKKLKIDNQVHGIAHGT